MAVPTPKRTHSLPFRDAAIKKSMSVTLPGGCGVCVRAVCERTEVGPYTLDPITKTLNPRPENPKSRI
jgi:hypothetical protein